MLVFAPQRACIVFGWMLWVCNKIVINYPVCCGLAFAKGVCVVAFGEQSKRVLVRQAGQRCANHIVACSFFIRYPGLGHAHEVFANRFYYYAWWRHFTGIVLHRMHHLPGLTGTIKEVHVDPIHIELALTDRFGLFVCVVKVQMSKQCVRYMVQSKQSFLKEQQTISIISLLMFFFGCFNCEMNMSQILVFIPYTMHTRYVASRKSNWASNQYFVPYKKHIIKSTPISVTDNTKKKKMNTVSHHISADVDRATTPSRLCHIRFKLTTISWPHAHHLNQEPSAITIVFVLADANMLSSCIACCGVCDMNYSTQRHHSDGVQS